VIALHLLEPELSITWSYAHLSREGWRVGAALLLSVTLPFLGAWAWTSRASKRPLQRLAGARLAALGTCAIGGLAALGAIAPAPPSNYDSTVLLDTVRGARDGPVRWMLSTASLQALVGPFIQQADPTRWVAAANSAFAGVGLLGLIAAAREIAQTRGEAFALSAIVLSAFGTAQIAIGYLEVYPLALALVGSYIGFAARSLQRGDGLATCAAIVAIGPFFYIGLALLAPSAIVLGLLHLRREGGGRRVVRATVIGVLVAAAATVPHYGVPFAWAAFAAEVTADNHALLGLQAGSPLLPLSYLWSTQHLKEVLHSLLLVDPVGWLLLLFPGLALLRREGPGGLPPIGLFLASIAVPYALYAFAMDPLYGVYLDWDLWVTGAPAISLLGGWAFLTWGRDQPRVTGALLGLALACAGVHALARLHAIPVEAERHLQESPFHISSQMEIPRASRRATSARDA
jgi:hypothetical protein